MIQETKPPKEHAIRFKYFKPVKGTLGDNVLLKNAIILFAACETACETAWAAKTWVYRTARAAYEAGADRPVVYERALAAFETARAAWEQAWARYCDSIPPADLDALHRAECVPECPYLHGKTNIFEEVVT
jgi:hypothetical protein